MGAPHTDGDRAGGTLMSTTTTSARRSGTSRKVRALLAGGVVLGIGAAATLAAWNDSEYAGATFTAGSFNLEGAVDGADGSYTDHASDRRRGAAGVQPAGRKPGAR